jgi:polyphosphate kinase
MSCSQQLGEDVHKIFMQLTSLTAARDLQRILQAPFNLFEELVRRIEREIEQAEKGKKAHIIAKINALVEPQLIDCLYRASAAGVRIDLIVRGMCSLRPGVPGLSENVTIRSIVGRFLEHSRVYYFFNGGDEEYFCSSADWMERNFFRRTETCFPVRHRRLKDRIRADLELYLADNCQAWSLNGDGSYDKLRPQNGETPVSAQQSLLADLSGSS